LSQNLSAARKLEGIEGYKMLIKAVTPLNAAKGVLVNDDSSCLRLKAVEPEVMRVITGLGIWISVDLLTSPLTSPSPAKLGINQSTLSCAILV
jgi:hypothetical protein